MSILLAILSGAASACGTISDDPWFSWRAPSVVYSGQVNHVTVVENEFAFVEISIPEVNGSGLVTVVYSVGFASSPPLPVRGEHIVVAARPSPLDPLRLQVQDMFRGVPSRHGLVMADKSRFPITAVWCDTGIEHAALVIDESAAGLPPDAPRTAPADDDYLLQQAIFWEQGLKQFLSCI